MILRKLDIRIQNNESIPYLAVGTKLKSKWTKNFSTETDTHKSDER